MPVVCAARGQRPLRIVVAEVFVPSVLALECEGGDQTTVDVIAQKNIKGDIYRKRKGCCL